MSKTVQNEKTGQLQGLPTFSKFSTSLKIPFVQTHFSHKGPFFVIYTSTDVLCLKNWGRTPASTLRYAPCLKNWGHTPASILW